MLGRYCAMTLCLAAAGCLSPLQREVADLGYIPVPAANDRDRPGFIFDEGHKLYSELPESAVPRRRFSATWETIENRSSVEEQLDVAFLSSARGAAGILAARGLKSFAIRPGEMTIESVDKRAAQQFLLSPAGLALRRGIVDEEKAYVITESIGTDDLTYDFSSNTAAALQLDANLLADLGISGSSRTVVVDVERRTLRLTKFQYLGYKLDSIAALVREGEQAKPVSIEEGRRALEALELALAMKARLDELETRAAPRRIDEHQLASIAVPASTGMAVYVRWVESDQEAGALALQVARGLSAAGWAVNPAPAMLMSGPAGAPVGLTVEVAPAIDGAPPEGIEPLYRGLCTCLRQRLPLLPRPDFDPRRIQVTVGAKPQLPSPSTGGSIAVNAPARAGDATGGSKGGDVRFRAGNGPDGGDVEVHADLRAGDAAGGSSGGNVEVRGGDATDPNGRGGDVWVGPNDGRR